MKKRESILGKGGVGLAIAALVRAGFRPIAHTPNHIQHWARDGQYCYLEWQGTIPAESELISFGHVRFENVYDCDESGELTYKRIWIARADR